MRIRRSALWTVVAAAAALLVAVTTPAMSATAAVPGTAAATYTPWLLSSPVDQNVQELVPCGTVMYAVGTISALQQGSTRYARGNAFSFSATTGKVTTWDPKVNGHVNSIALTPDCSTAFLGGTFTQAGTTKAIDLVAVDTATGAVRTGFAHVAGGEVDTVRYVGGRLFVGGRFTKINGVARTYLASLDPATGAVTPYLDLAISGEYPKTSTKVFNSQVSHSGDKLLIEGVFTNIAGQERQQMAMLQLGATSATLGAWYSKEFDNRCITLKDFYVRTATWSPDDSKIFIGTTGDRPTFGPGFDVNGPRAGLCDAAAGFNATNGLVSHLWVNYTGCDTIYSIGADTTAVYVAGHERWMNNINGCNVAGAGAISRPGLAALNPVTGAVLPWNPTRSLGHGATGITVTSAGVWVASDTWTNGGSQMCGGKLNHGGICFLPY